MTRPKNILVLISAVLLVAAFSGAGMPTELDSNAAPQPVQIAVPDAAAPVPGKNPMMQAIWDQLEEARQQRALLLEEAERTTEPAAFLQIQRKIEQLHEDTEMAILEIQAEHFREIGALDALREIEEAIAVMSSPRKGFPEPRSLPDGDSGQ